MEIQNNEETTKIDVAQVSSVLDRILEKDPNAPVLESAETTIPVEELRKEEPKAEEPAKKEIPVEQKSKGDIPALRKAHEESKKELASLKEQLAEFEGTRKERDELKSKIEEYNTQLAELRKIDSISKLENDPDFQKKYVESYNSSVNKLKELSEYADIDAKDILTAMAKPPKERYAAIDDVLSMATPTLAAKIRAEVDRIEDIETGKRAELSDASTRLQKMREERELEQSRESSKRAEYAELSFKETSATLAKELGIDESVITKAREFAMKNSDMKEAHKIIIKAFAHDNTAKELAEAKAELAKYRQSSPGVSSGNNGNVAKIGDDVDFVTAIKQGVRNLNLY